MMFLAFGASSLVAFHAEQDANKRFKNRFKMPFLWLGVAAAGVFLSLDEMTILHENLFWREIRQVTHDMGGFWVYLPQWQVFYAPILLLILGICVVLFLNRYDLRSWSFKTAAGGLGCWASALLLEALRNRSRLSEEGAYQVSVVCEELCEWIGAALLVVSILVYLRKIAIKQDSEEMALYQARPMVTRFSLTMAAFALILCSPGAIVVISSAKKSEKEKAPLPRLHQRIKKPPPRGSGLRLFSGGLAQIGPSPEPPRP